MISQLWERTKYISPINYITSTYIREYDISKANINILLKLGAISEADYMYFDRLDKKAREIMIGYYLRDHKEENLGTKLIDSIRDHRRMFFEANHIEDKDVLAIKTDAIYLIEKIAKVTEFDNVKFMNKKTYTSYYRLDKQFNKGLYYYLDRVHAIDVLDIDGMSDYAYERHKDYMIDFLKSLFYTIETSGVEDGIQLLQVFIDKYIKMDLDIQYYRRFDSLCGYDTIISTVLDHIQYNVDGLTNKDKNLIDIQYNYGILVNLYKYVSSMYFNNQKKNHV